MGDTTRTFFAVEVPERLGLELVRLQRALFRIIPRMPLGHRAQHPFHMTLAFLGDVRNHDLSRLYELVASSVCRFEPIELRFEGLGAFPSPGRPRVLWAGISARNPELLSDIRKSVVAAAAESWLSLRRRAVPPSRDSGPIQAGPDAALVT